MNYVVIGNSTAAIGTVEGIRSIDTQGTIMLISDEPHRTYSRPLISYYLSGKIPESKMYYRSKDYYERLDISTRLGERVSVLRLAEKAVVLESGETIPYDRLMLATGAKPIVPHIPGRDFKGVHTFIKWDDVLRLEKVLRAGSRAVVIGAGINGLKAVEALVKCGVEVTVVEIANQVLSAILDETAAALVQKTLENHGVKFYLNTTVAEIVAEKEAASGVRLQDGRILDCEQVVITIGISPNIDLAEKTDIKVNRGILVDEHMATSVPDVYAAGDVAEVYDSLYRERRVLPVIPNTYKQGFNAGVNMAGKVQSYGSSFAMVSIGFFELPLITSGIVKPEGEGFTELADTASPQDYRKVILREGRIVGYVVLNRVDCAGGLASLMEKEVDVRSFQQDLFKENFNYANFLQSPK
ncbi:FAD-dependent oxidoreductase [Desulfosporosinus sp. PR]|uniref:NAD(P)/FAD-dependent oxidoreductase n=1 Tax=Candidatus Desulfosporosinus nitrosoreducens TaxID=3401928 RepID=UPI0027E85C76|nr:FAD-dependent oxidoreductase [Desulfosporosinus sp. PR]MDQ7093116.1 FAD-dependent oxidoreductase [Desulfosporosinus sp. PR]